MKFRCNKQSVPQKCHTVIFTVVTTASCVTVKKNEFLVWNSSNRYRTSKFLFYQQIHLLL